MLPGEVAALAGHTSCPFGDAGAAGGGRGLRTQLGLPLARPCAVALRGPCSAWLRFPHGCPHPQDRQLPHPHPHSHSHNPHPHTAALCFRDTVLAAETCEELFTPHAPHIDLALAGAWGQGRIASAC